VNSTPESFNDIIEIGHFFGAHTVDVAVDTVTLEVAGSEEKIEKLINMLQEYDIREVARSGRVVMRRDVTDSEVTSNKEKE
jgi:acetolactate synthase-1/3 small subunit